MSDNELRGSEASLEMTEDERLIILYVRSLELDRDEAIRRLSTPAPIPVLPCDQELHANLILVAEDPGAPESSPDAPES